MNRYYSKVTPKGMGIELVVLKATPGLTCCGLAPEFISSDGLGVEVV